MRKLLPDVLIRFESAQALGLEVNAAALGAA